MRPFHSGNTRPSRRAAGLAIVLALLAPPAFAQGTDNVVTLSQAVDVALSRHPQLASYPHDVRAAEGRILQSSLRPNPELDVEMENIRGGFPGTSRSETTAVLSQTFEPGKRAPRIRRDEAELAVLRMDHEGLRRAVASDVRRAFLVLQAAQERLALVREAQRLASALASVAAERVAAGAVSPIESTRAKVENATAAADVERALREFEDARRELSAAMGEDAPSFDAASGTLSGDLSVPDLGGLQAGLAAHPELARWDAERERRRAALAAERSRINPDITLKGGVAHLREEEERRNTLVLGFSLPIPLFDRNEGGIREAEAQLAKTDAERRGTELSLATRLGRQHATLAAAAREARTLREEALAGAQEAYAAVDEGYRLGKFRYLDLLDAGKALVEARQRYLEALVEVNLARAEIERLAAPPGEGRKEDADKEREGAKR